MLNFKCKQSELLERFTSQEFASEFPPSLAREINRELFRYLKGNGFIEENNRNTMQKPGRLGVKVPGTSIHIKMKELVADIIRLSLYTFFLTQGEISSSIGLFDTIESMSKKFHVLNKHNGHLCIYLSIVQAKRQMAKDKKKKSPTSEDVYHLMKSNNNSCQEGCRFYQGNLCGQKKKDFKNALAKLEEAGVVKINSDRTLSILF